MTIEIAQEFSIPIEEIQVDIHEEAIDNLNHFIIISLVEKHYKKQGFEVLSGRDFESNIILGLFSGQEKRILDRYTKVKLGTAKKTPLVDEYNEKIFDVFSSEQINNLLYLCRICSYSGGPGLPDFIILKDGSFSLCYVGEDLLNDQKLFIILAKCIFCISGIKILNVRFKDAPPLNSHFKIHFKQLLSDVLHEKKNKELMEELVSLIEHEKENKDELDYLIDKEKSIPLFLFKEWVEKGKVSAEDLIENRNFLKKLNEKDKQRFLEWEREIKNDRDFDSLREMRDEESLKKKALYFQKKFSIGESRAKEFMMFMDFKE